MADGNGTPIEKQFKWRQHGRTFLQPLLVAALVVLLFWIASAAITAWWVTDLSQRGQFGDAFGAVNSLFSGLAFAAVAIALVLQNHSLALQNHALGLQLNELNQAHEWNRRKAAHDLLIDSSLGKFGDLRRGLEKRIDIYDHSQTSATLNPPLTAEEKLQLDAVLNYLETSCMSVKNGVVDEEIVCDCFHSLLPAYWRWAAPYVKECRGRDMGFWTDLEPYADKWLGESERKRQAALKAVVKPGKGKLQQ